MNKHDWLGLMTLILVTATARADLEAGIAAFKRLDYAAAMAELRPPAEQGDAEAQYYVGVLYQFGKGVEPSDKTAYTWYRKAAVQGHAEAQYNVGYLHTKGQGVPRNDEQALKWYLSAAKQGFAPAQVSVGTFYRSGRGVPQDYSEAMKWYRRAAVQGHGLAQAKLAFMYQSVTDAGEPDLVQSYAWFDLALAQGEEVQEFRDAVAQRLTPAQLEQARTLARAYRSKYPK
jgi:TPR repeat protein